MSNPGNSRRIGVQSALSRLLQRGKREAKDATSALSNIWKSRGGRSGPKRMGAK